MKNRKKIVQEIANEMHWVIENGQRRRRSTLELVLLELRNKSLEGIPRAVRTHHKLLDKYRAKEAQQEGPFAIFPEKLTTEEWIEKYTPKQDENPEKESM